MNAYLLFVGFVLTVCVVGGGWLLLAALGLVPDPTDTDERSV